MREFQNAYHSLRLKPKILDSCSRPFAHHPDGPSSTSGLTVAYHVQARRSSSAAGRWPAQLSNRRRMAPNKRARFSCFSISKAFAVFLFGPDVVADALPFRGDDCSLSGLLSARIFESLRFPAFTSASFSILVAKLLSRYAFAASGLWIGMPTTPAS